MWPPLVISWFIAPLTIVCGEIVQLRKGHRLPKIVTEANGRPRSSSKVMISPPLTLFTSQSSKWFITTTRGQRLTTYLRTELVGAQVCCFFRVDLKVPNSQSWLKDRPDFVRIFRKLQMKFLNLWNSTDIGFVDYDISTLWIWIRDWFWLKFRGISSKCGLKMS